MVTTRKLTAAAVVTMSLSTIGCIPDQPSIAQTVAPQSTPLSAAESDLRFLGWMRGFPPPPDKLIMQPDSNYFSFPKLRWTVCHLREFLPTEQVSRGLGAPVSFEYAIDDGIDGVTFTPTQMWQVGVNRCQRESLFIIKLSIR